MYSQFREENAKPAKKSHRNTPSFSSSLLDEICRSIDDKPAATGFRAKTKRDDETRSRLVEKWMENDKTVFRRRPIQCVFPDDFPTKPVRTDQRDSYLFDDYEEHERITNREQTKSSPKLRALKFYDNLKKMKQPISPGARLTTFINSIFNRSKSKSKPNPNPNPKPRDSNSNNDDDIDRHHRLRKTAAATKIISDHRRNIHINNNNNNNIVIGRPPLPPNAFRNSTRCSLDDDEDEDEDEDEDALSESSSDLFELDHLSFGHGDRDRDIMFSELPVYETTVFHNNRRFIR